MHLPKLEVKSIMYVLVHSNKMIECQCVVLGGMQYYVRFGTLEFNDTICAIYVRFL